MGCQVVIKTRYKFGSQLVVSSRLVEELHYTK